MEKTGFRNFVKGIVVGGSMLIPGVSGGTMAMISVSYTHLIMNCRMTVAKALLWWKVSLF